MKGLKNSPKVMPSAAKIAARESTVTPLSPRSSLPRPLRNGSNVPDLTPHAPKRAWRRSDSISYLEEWFAWITRYARVELGGFLGCLIPAERAD